MYRSLAGNRYNFTSTILFAKYTESGQKATKVRSVIDYANFLQDETRQR